MAWAAVASTAVSIGGSLLSGKNSSDAAGRAADAQAQSADSATAEQRRQYDITRGDALNQYRTARADNAPFLATGTAANTRLAGLLGLRVPKAAAPLAAGITLPSWVDSGRYQNDSQYRSAVDAENSSLQSAGYSSGINNSAYVGNSGDVEGEINSKLAQFPVSTTSGEMEPVGSDFGDLNRKFTAADLNADPVYQSGLKFGLDTGTNAINARAIAGGGYDSGATLKALTQFGNDYGSQKAGDSYNRFVADQGNTYNRLAGVSGTGQTAVNTVGNAGQNMVSTIAGAGSNAANNISNNMMGAGNARAAGIIGGSQAWGSAASGVNNAFNNYNSNQTLRALMGRNNVYQLNNNGYNIDQNNYSRDNSYGP